jgi:hypothetical protein
MKTAIPLFLLVFGSVIAAIGLSGAIALGLDKSETQECLKLQHYSETYSEFYITEWQQEMCSYQEVEVNAPVK